jgi:hypothetical protein
MDADRDGRIIPRGVEATVRAKREKRESMQRHRNIWGLTRLALPLVSVALATVSCDPKVNPAADPEAITAGGGSGGVGGEPSAGGPPPDELGENGPAEPGENVPVASIDPGGSVGSQSSGAVVSCEGDAGVCGDAGVEPACVPTGPRDCSSDLDNDCDGQPDNVVDDVCVCALGTPEACDEHAGLDGNGLCRAGLRTCVLAADGLTSEWGACEGAVGPGGPDSCTVRGDDADCDGTPNSDCVCVDGETQQCGSTTDTGPCAIGTSSCVNARFGECIGARPPAAQDSCVPGDDGNCNGRPNDRFCACLDGATQQCGVTGTGVCELGTQTCVNGSFGPCVGNVDPRGRDCRSQQDNDCNGSADNTRDNTCRCSIGDSQACQTHPGLDGIGRCRAGTQTCVAGANNSSSDFGGCTGSVGPAAQDSCTVAGDDANCNGVANDGCACGSGVGSTPIPAVTRGTSTGAFGTPGGVLNGTYFLTDIFTPPVLAQWSGEILEFRDEDGTFRRKRTAFSPNGQGNTTVESGTFQYAGNSVVLETDSVECGSGGVVMSSDGTWLYTVGGGGLKLQVGGGLIELHYLTAIGFGI